MRKMEEEKKKKQEELKRLKLHLFSHFAHSLVTSSLYNFKNLFFRKRDERLRRVFEAKVKEEQREEEKKKKIEQKMAQIDEKNDKVCNSASICLSQQRFNLLVQTVKLLFFMQRLAEEKAKKKVAMKRQEELEQKKKMEEEVKRKKIQQAVRHSCFILSVDLQYLNIVEELCFVM